MQILYVLGILTLAMMTFDSVYMGSTQRDNIYKIASKRTLDAKTQKSLSQMAYKAYEYGRQGTSCPSGTTNHSAQGAGGAGGFFRLCWSENVVGGCFENVRTKTGAVCIASNQMLMSYNTRSAPLYVQIFNFLPEAQASLRRPTAANYSGMASNPFPRGAGGGAGSANVLMPLPNTVNSVNSNHIDCGQGHTECFSVVYCLNGRRDCTGRDRILNTYAVRYF